MSVLIKGITLKQFYRDLNNVRDMDPDWDIAQLPDDVVERKKGKWVGGNGVDYVRCGCCHKNYDWVSQAQYYNFCPNCGADMSGEENAQS